MNWSERYHRRKRHEEMRERFAELHEQVKVRALIAGTEVTATDDARIEAWVKALKANAKKPTKRKGTIGKLVDATKQA
jgi:hypothetical protein